MLEKTRWIQALKIAMEPATNFASFRTQRLKMAMLSSFAGKGVSVISQLIALPLAIAALGIEKFGVYAMLIAILNWMNMAGVAISPGLTVEIVSATSKGEREREAQVFTTAFWFALIVSMFLFFALNIFLYFFGVGELFGLKSLVYKEELQSGLKILSIFFAVNIVLSVVEATQAGYQNQYFNNILITCGGIITIIALLTVVRTHPTIPNMILAVYGAPLVVRTLNIFQLFWGRSYLVPKLSLFSFPLLRSILTTGSAFLLTLAGTFCYQSFSVYWAGRELGAASAAYMFVMMLVLNIAGSLLIIITQPLWPAIQDAVVRGDLDWVRRAHARLIRSLMPYVGLAAIILALTGDYIMGFWIKTGSDIDIGTQILWGLYFLIIAWDHINYTVLIGLSRFWFASLWFTFGAYVMLLASLYLVNILGINGIFIAMCLGPLLVTVWLFPVEIKRILPPLIKL